MLNQAQVLLKRSCTFGKLVNIQITGITLLCTGNNNICISCVLNGFKYTSKNVTVPFTNTTWLNFYILHVHVTLFILDTDKHVFWQTVKIQLKPAEGGIST